MQKYQSNLLSSLSIYDISLSILCSVLTLASDWLKTTQLKHVSHAWHYQRDIQNERSVISDVTTTATTTVHKILAHFYHLVEIPYIFSAFSHLLECWWNAYIDRKQESKKNIRVNVPFIKSVNCVQLKNVNPFNYVIAMPPNDIL